MPRIKPGNGNHGETRSSRNGLAKEVSLPGGLSTNNLDDPTTTDSKLLAECNWVMNESPNRKLYLAGKRMVGKQTRMIQNVAGWAEHNAKEFLSIPKTMTLTFTASPSRGITPCPSRNTWVSGWRHSPAKTE